MSREIKRRGVKKLVFPERITVGLDNDVQALMNASTNAGVKWVTFAHAINAGLRLAFLKFKPPELQVRCDPWEQVVFAKPITVKRLAKSPRKS